MRRPVTGALLAVPLLLAGAVACGGGGDPAAASGDGSDNTDDQGVQFAQCLRDNGIDVPDPDPDTGRIAIRGDLGSIDQGQLRAAMEACQEFAPFGGQNDGGQRNRLDDPDAQEALLAFAECMRENGVDMPDPDTSGGLFAVGGDLANDPDFQDAIEACQPILQDVFGDRPAVVGGGDG